MHPSLPFPIPFSLMKYGSILRNQSACTTTCTTDGVKTVAVDRFLASVQDSCTYNMSTSESALSTGGQCPHSNVLADNIVPKN